MAEIQAANLKGIDVNAIVRSMPTVGRRIMELDRRLNASDFSDSELAELCDLLVAAGVPERSEELLRCSARVGDALHRKYIQLFGGDIERLFRRAVQRFTSQFAVSLSKEADPGFVHETYSGVGDCKQISSKLPASPTFDVIFSMPDRTTVIADVIVPSDFQGNGVIAADASALRFVDNRWQA